MKKGFTLVELLAIIILLAGIFMLTYPKLTEIFEKEKNSIDEMELDTIYDAVDRYIENRNEFSKNVGSEYCISVETIDNEGLIPFDTDEYLDKAIRIKVGKSSNYHNLVTKEIVGENNECKREEGNNFN